MQEMIPTKDIDENGTWHINRNAKGCKHCGTVEVHYATNGRAAIYHAGVSCCRKAIEDQVKYRQWDIQRARQQVIDYRQRVLDMEVKVNQSQGKEKTDLQREYMRLANGQRNFEDNITNQVKGNHTLGMIGYENELRELQRQLAEWPA